MLCYKKKIKCYKLNLKIILINKFFEINFLKTFLCSKKIFKVQKKSKKKITLKKNFRVSDRYTCTFLWDDSQRASGHFKINFFKIVSSQKKFFYWDVAFEIRMFTLYMS
jgi:hypothetical protein